MKIIGFVSYYLRKIAYFCRKKKMSKIFWLLLLLVAIFICVLLIKNIPYYTPAEKQTGINIRHHHDDTIRIGYIGDSWADGHKKINCVIDSIVGNATGRTIEVRTAGISGLTSKNIYYSIFRDDSIRRVIEWGPDYCFVVAGINDSDRKMGKYYYKENMRLIIELLLENHITPVILEIPSYDILSSYKRRSRQVKLQYLISMLATCSKMDCIADYRNVYKDLIKEKGWNDSVITIFYNEWNPNGYKDDRGLYDGGLMHLNKKGYFVLDSCISDKITHHLSSQRFSSNQAF